VCCHEYNVCEFPNYDSGIRRISRCTLSLNRSRDLSFTAEPSSMEADAPKKIGKYDVVDLIGRGEMGVVYKAVDRALGRLVAIKMVTGAAAQGNLLKRFYQEAQFTNLRHTNIVIVYDLGDFEGRPYVVMEYLDGQSLKSMLPTKTITMLQKISCVRQICSDLEYAHSRQPSIIHGDIKPANIVVFADGR
jgi:serine/threonine protein kinase